MSAAPLRAIFTPGGHRLRGEPAPAARARLRHPSPARERRSAHPLAHELLEHRVARVLRDAHAARERQVREVEVARAPAEQVGVERHHDGFAAGCLGPAQQRGVELVRRRPVELEQPRAAGRGIPHLLHREGCLVAERVRDAEGCRGPRDREVGVGVRHLHDAERREQERRRATAAEEVDRQVARRDVAQRPRPHLPALERGAVGGHVRSAPAPPRCRRTPRRSAPCARPPRARRRRPARGASCR